MSATFFAALLYLPQFMQNQLGYSPLEAGVGILPFLATFAARLLRRRPALRAARAKLLAVLGAACITVAPFLFSHVDARSGYGSLIPGMVVLGIGVGSFYPTATTAGVTSVDESQTSLAGGIVYMFQIAGGSIGLGLTTTVFSAQIPPFVDGIQAAFRLDAALSLVGFLIVLFFVGGRLLGRRGAAEAPAWPQHWRRRSWRMSLSPEPPIRMSLPGPPRRTSSPAPPKSESLPGPPKISVVAVAADQSVVAVAADQLVGAGAADQRVVARAAAHRHRDRRPRLETTTESSPPPALTSKAATAVAWQISSFGLPAGCSQTVPPTSSGATESIT